MQIQGTVHIHGPQAMNAPHRIGKAEQTPNPAAQQIDQLDISPEADMVSRAHEAPAMRLDRIAEIRAAIAEGTYDTDAKMSAALDRLLDEIG